MSLVNAALTNRGFQALAAYRLARRLHLRRVPLLPMILTRIVQVLYGIDIDWRAHIEPGVVIRHGVGVVIGQGARVGSGSILYHGVTLGYTGDQARGGLPAVGRNVLIGAGAVILGSVKVGDGARIGANTVVLTDVPPDATVVGNPARIINR
jgi:serine O-acetyltransferase